MASCFISYSNEDVNFAKRLYDDLTSAGISCWFFPETATWGEPVWGAIGQGITTYDRVIVVCSKHSLKSGPVLREIERALQREDREKKNVLFPVRIDNYVFANWKHPRKPDVTSKVVGDFSTWNSDPNSYNSSLARLLQILV